MQSAKDNINIKYSDGNCRVLSRWLSCNACRVRMAYRSQRHAKRCGQHWIQIGMQRE